MSYNSTNVLRKGSSDLSVIESVLLIGEEAKSYACRYLKTMEKSINLAFHTWIIIEHVPIEVVELRCVPL